MKLKSKTLFWSLVTVAMLLTSSGILTGCQGYAAPPDGFVDTSPAAAPVAWDATDPNKEHAYRGLSQ